MDDNARHYASDRRPLASPIVVSWSLYLAISEIMFFIDSGERLRAMTALGALYLHPEMGPLIRNLENEL